MGHGWKAQHVSVRRITLVFAVVLGLLLPTTSALAAQTFTLTVNPEGISKGTVTDDLGGIDCGSDCQHAYPQTCESADGPLICDPVQVELTTTIPPGFSTSWSNCSAWTAATCTVTGGNVNGTNSSKTVGITYTDVTNPTVSITSPPAGSIHTTGLAVSAAASDNHAIQKVQFRFGPAGGAVVSTVDDPTAPYAMTYDTSSRPDGDYTVTVQATDASGRTSSSVSRTFTVDKTPPSLVVNGPGSTAAPGPWLAGGRDRTWTFDVSDATTTASVTCAEDTAPVTCTGGLAGHTMTAPAAGNHSFTVTAKDSANNQTSETRHFRVDASAPTLSVSGLAHNGITNDRTATFPVTATDAESGVGSVTCSVDGATAAACGTSFTTPPLADGLHTLAVVATNSAGMKTRVNRTFTVDGTAPDTKITSGPRRPFSLSSAAGFAVSAVDGGGGFACRLDSASWGSCSQAYTALGAGTHQFAARSSDRAGNVDATPATWTWTVPHDDRALRFGKGWSGLTKSKFWNSTALKARAKGATLTRRDVGARQLALVATSCPKCGTVDIFHGKKRLKRISLASPTTRNRRIFAVAKFASVSAARNLRIVVVSSRKPVIVDGIGIATR